MTRKYDSRVTLLLGFHLGCYVPEISQLLFTHAGINLVDIRLMARMFLNVFYPSGKEQFKLNESSVFTNYVLF